MSLRGFYGALAPGRHTSGEWRGILVRALKAGMDRPLALAREIKRRSQWYISQLPFSKSALPATFCFYPFVNIDIRTDGKASLCCRADENISHLGRDLSLHTETFEEIWNSRYMQEVRRKMLSGKPVAACDGCYRFEASGIQSLRQKSLTWGNYAMGTLTLKGALAKAARLTTKAGYKRSPSSLQLWLGNLCNLKCRMCSPVFSSQIAADSVQSAWIGAKARVEVLLPGFIRGVGYTGFGSLVERQGQPYRKLAAGSVCTIALPQTGVLISALDISGVTLGNTGLCSLKLVAGDRTLLDRPSMLEKNWSYRIDLTPPLNTEGPIHLSFHVNHADVAIQSFKAEADPQLGKVQPKEIISRFPENPAWAENRSVLIDEIFSDPSGLQTVSFAGGEPMINPHLPSIIDVLEKNGGKDKLALYFSTNATKFPDDMIDRLRVFRSTTIALSVDGTGLLQEYIRYPSRWSVVESNIEKYNASGLTVEIHPTLQAYNAFGLLNLVRYCDQRSLKFTLVNVLEGPAWLSLDMLPPQVVDEALQAWQEYRQRDCQPHNTKEVDAVLSALKRPRAINIAELQEKFVRYTNALDKTRSASLARACPRLYDSLLASGLSLSG